jgi:hypothetical protein
VSLGEALTRWSVRAAILFMIAAWLMMIRRRDFSANLFWTLGFFAYLVHLWAAFEYFHHWSHAAAVADTARQTRELVGFEFGGGVWANYLFTIVWGADVFWRWMRPESFGRRPRWMNRLVHGFLSFIAFNATVVFATGVSRWIGIVGCALLGLASAHWPTRPLIASKGGAASSAENP